MTATDWIVVAVMLGAVGAAILFDRIIARRHTDRAEDHRRLMAEVRKLP